MIFISSPLGILGRCWLAKYGVTFKVGRRKKKKRSPVVENFGRKIPWSNIHERVKWEIKQRMVNARTALFGALYKNYSKVVCLLTTNIKHWIKMDSAYIPDIERLSRDKTKFELVYTRQSEVFFS